MSSLLTILGATAMGFFTALGGIYYHSYIFWALIGASALLYGGGFLSGYIHNKE